MAEDKKKATQELPEVQDAHKVFQVLRNELGHFQATARQYKRESGASKFLRKSKNLFRSSKSADKRDIFGETIAESFPIARIKDNVKRLQSSPLNSEARLGLVEPFAMKGIKGDLLVYRHALIHAMFELTSFHISSEKLDMAIMAQRRYLDKLAAFFGEEIASCQTKLKNINTKGEKKQEDSKFRAETTEEITRNMEENQKKYQFVKEISTIFRGKQLNQPLEIDIGDLRTGGSLKDADLKTIFPLLGAMVALPIVQANTQMLIDVVKSGAPRIPAGGFYESRMHRLYSKFLFTSYIAGSQDVKEECKKTVVASYNSINATLPIIGDKPKSKLEKTSVREFGMVSLLVFQQLPLLGSAPSKQHVQAMSKAVKLLETISDEPGILELKSALRKRIPK